MDETFPDLGSLTDLELKDVIRSSPRGDGDLLQAAHPARQDRHSSRRACQPPTPHHEDGNVLITGEDVQKLTDILATASRTRG